MSRGFPTDGRRWALPRTVVTVVLVASALISGAAAASAAPSSDSEIAVLTAPPPQNSLALGAVFVTNSPSWSRILGRQFTGGAIVIEVIPGSPAETAGIRAGDVIAAIDGKEVDDSDEASFLLRSAVGIERRLSLSRPDESARSIDVQLEKSAASLVEHLRQRIARNPDLVTRYLYAQTVPDGLVSLEFTDLILRDMPDFAPAASLRARKMAELAVAAPAASSQGVLVEAQERAKMAVDLDPASADVRVDAAFVLLASNMPAQAESMASSALERDPGSVAAHRVLGLARLASEQPTLAVAALREAVRLDPYARDSYQLLAAAYRRSGHAANADSVIQTMNAIRSQNDSPYAMLGARRDTVLVMTALSMAVGLALAWLLGRRRSPSLVKAPRNASPTDPISVAELLGAFGLWAAAIPVISPALGLAPETTRRLLVADHVVPGLLVTMVASVLLFGTIGGGLRDDVSTVLPAVTFLLGFWITATHVPLLLQAAQHQKPWSLAVFHSSAGPPIALLSIRLHRMQLRADTPSSLVTTSALPAVVLTETHD